MASLRFGRVDGPLGPMWVAETDAGVAAVSRADSPQAMLDGLRRRFPGLSPVADRIDVDLRRAFQEAVDQHRLAFEQGRVLLTLCIGRPDLLQEGSIPLGVSGAQIIDLNGETGGCSYAYDSTRPVTGSGQMAEVGLVVLAFDGEGGDTVLHCERRCDLVVNTPTPRSGQPITSPTA